MTPIYIDEYNYPLPEERIAKYPPAQRDHSKLLIYREGQIEESRFFKIGEFLPKDSLLIYNNTRVIQARLVFHKQQATPTGETQQGARIEVFCLEPIQPHDYQLSLGSQSGCTWKCMVGNLKKWKQGKLSLQVGKTTLWAERLSTNGNTHEVQFTWETQDEKQPVAFAEILDAMGELPIPPYLNRKTEESDKTTYQTVYSRIKGSVAAPTAGLHFTDEVLQGLRQQGVEMAEVTLHVGAGTFQPVKVADANQHTMHTEIISVERNTIAQLCEHVGHIVAVGTTSMRTLESLYFIGKRLHEEGLEAFKDATGVETIHVGQFEPYKQATALGTKEALQAILDYLDQTQQTTLHGETQIMIRPGYEFHVVEQLITNFHQPKSTLLLLVSAFVQGDWHRIYEYALEHEFRFLSYGDSSILFKSKSITRL